ncbi:MAG: heme-binding domain-containing protein [Aureispira sp.]
MNKRRIFLILVVVLVVIQFIPTDKSAPDIKAVDTFANTLQPPEAILTQLKSSCYDCHSYETTYPWYTHIAPVSFWIRGHIKNARKALNFSTWGEQSVSDQKHLLHECAEEIAEGHMPPKGYYRMHEDAYLDDTKKGALETWLEAQSQL